MRDMSLGELILTNLLLLTIWHCAMFAACVLAKPSLFNENRALYRPRGWEQNGRWYAKHLKINVWKDKLPQHVGKDGFSKAHITDLSEDYLNRFILETCRGEWDHWMNCLFFVLSLVINPLLPGIIFGLITLAGNLPFIAIQRYNRFRLLTVRKRLLREKARLQRNGGEEVLA